MSLVFSQDTCIPPGSLPQKGLFKTAHSPEKSSAFKKLINYVNKLIMVLEPTKRNCLHKCSFLERRSLSVLQVTG